MRRVAVVGYGNTSFKRRHAGKTFPRLAYEAVRDALAMAGVKQAEVQGAVYGIYSDLFTHNMMPELHIHYQLGLARKPAVRVTAGGATGGVALRAAWLEVAGGLRDLVLDTAAEEQIPVQTDHIAGGGTDAGRMHLFGAGVPSLVIGVPVRYIHTHASIMHRDDFEQAVRLLVAVIRRLDAETVQALKA